MKSCLCSNLKKFWTKKYIGMSYVSQSEPTYFSMVTSLTAQFLKNNVPHSDDLHRCITYYNFDLLTSFLGRYLDFSKNSLFCEFLTMI